MFVDTGELAFCTLRADLLLSFIDAGQAEIVDRDLCRKFAWVLDTSVHEGSVDTARVLEVERAMTKITGARTRAGNPILGDIAMVARDPHAMGVILSSIWARITNHLIPQEFLPRDDENILVLTKLIHLGATARSMMMTKTFKEDDTSVVAIIHQFYPALMTNILQNQLSQSIQLEHDSFLQMFLEDSAARKVALYYGLMCCAQRDAQSTIVILDLLGEFEADEIASELWFFQSLIRELTHLQTQTPITGPTQDCITSVLNQLVESFSIHSSIHKEIQQHLITSVHHIPLLTLLSHIKHLLGTDTARLHLQGYVIIKEKLGASKLSSKNGNFLMQWIMYTTHTLAVAPPPATSEVEVTMPATVNLSSVMLSPVGASGTTFAPPLSPSTSPQSPVPESAGALPSSPSHSKVT